MDNHERIWILLTRKLSEEISEDEILEFNRVLSANPEFTYIVQVLTDFWHHSPQLNIEEAKEAFEKLKKRLSEKVVN